MKQILIQALFGSFKHVHFVYYFKDKLSKILVFYFEEFILFNIFSFFLE